MTLKTDILFYCKGKDIQRYQYFCLNLAMHEHFFAS